MLVTLLLSSTAAAGSVVIQDGQVSASSDFNASSVLYVNSATGSVGIGTAASQRPLHISAAQDANLRLQDTLGASPAAYVEFYNDTTRWGYVGLGGHDDKMVVGTTAEKNLAFYANNSQKMILTAAGYVGIGTTSPSQMLDVAGNANLSSDSSNLYFGGYSGTGKIFSDSGGDLNIKTTNDWILIDSRFGTDFRIDGTPKMRLTSDNGYLGIGTTNPSYRLDVNGTVNAYSFIVNGSPLSTSQWTTSGSDIYYTTGKVGIGTASPRVTFHVVGANQPLSGAYYSYGNMLVSTSDAEAIDIGGAISLGGVTGYTYARIHGKKGTTQAGSALGYLAFETDNNNNLIEHMRITSSGYVGIGTTTPSNKLEVVGNISATGKISSTSGDVCNSDGVCLSQLVGYRPLLNGAHNYSQCTALGGVVVPSDVALPICQIAGATCPSGWTAYQNYGTTNPGAYGAHGGYIDAADAVAHGQQSGWCCGGPQRTTTRNGFVNMALQCTGSWYAGSTPWSAGCDLCAMRASVCETWASRGCY